MRAARSSGWGATIAVCLAFVVPFSNAGSQRPSVDSARAGIRLKPEFRADGIFAGHPPRTVAHAGLGLLVPAGGYARVGLVGGVGPATDGVSGRVEAVVRFHTDPWADRRWAAYASLGAGVLWAAHTSAPFLMAAIGMDGARSRGWTPAFELGFSRGVRVAVVAHRIGDRR